MATIGPQRVMAKKVAFRVLAVGIVLLGFEVAFRLFARQPSPRLWKTDQHVHAWSAPREHLTYHDGWYSSRPNTDYQHIYPDDPRGYFHSGGSVEYRLNAEGFRGPSLQEDAGDSHRVLFLGDSFAFGEGVHLEDTFVAKLQQRLESRVSDGKPIQTINLAQPGQNPSNELKILERFGPTARAEVVVLVLTPNDWPSPFIEEVHGVDVRGEFIALFDEDPLYRVSRLLWWFKAHWRKYRLGRALEGALDDIPAVLPTDLKSRDQARQTVLQIRDRAKSHSAEFAVVVLPELVRLAPARYPYSYVHETIAALGQAEGFQVIDLRDDFMGRNPADLWVHAVDHHPNEQAHAIIAERIARELKCSFLRESSE